MTDNFCPWCIGPISYKYVGDLMIGICPWCNKSVIITELPRGIIKTVSPQHLKWDRDPDSWSQDCARTNNIFVEIKKSIKDVEEET